MKVALLQGLILQTIQIFKAMAKNKIRSLAFGSLSNIEYINFARQVADLIPSAKDLHVAESVVIGYNANIVKMANIVSHQPENDCTAIRTDMDDQYEDITATVDAFSFIQPSQEITDFITLLNKLVDRTPKAYRQRIR